MNNLRLKLRHINRVLHSGQYGQFGLGWMIGIDFLLFVLAMLVFAFFHHVRPTAVRTEVIVSDRGAYTAPAATQPAYLPAEDPTFMPEAATAAPENGSSVPYGYVAPLETPGVEFALTVPEETPAAQTFLPDGNEPVNLNDLLATPAPAHAGDFTNLYPGKFSSTTRAETDSYISPNLNITLRSGRYADADYHVLDIYVRDISCFQTVFAKDQYGKNIKEPTPDMSKRVGAVAAINGDYYGLREDGIVLRNGALYESEKYPDRDYCILYWDGTIETYAGAAFERDKIMAKGAYQIWNFGPSLLNAEGHAKEDFPDYSDIGGKNPRSVLGYIAPGHYLFVCVDGRQDDSEGIGLQSLAKLMEELGCVRAYNLDGGRTSAMYLNGANAADPYLSPRECSDCIVIVDSVTQ